MSQRTMNDHATPVDSALLERLSAAAPALEETGAWPRAQLEWLASAGVLGWNLPVEFGGHPLSPAEMAAAYESLAAACLTTAFVLTQRNAACQRIVESENTALKSALLPALAGGAVFATVGISHLTTSRQHLAQPAVSVTPDGDALRLSGSVPWVTGAEAADWIVTGGTCTDGRQLLIALPCGLPGVTVEASPRLLALNASRTSSLRLDDVRVPNRHVIAGPVPGVMGRATSSRTGSVTTSALALGLSLRAVRELETEAARRPDLREVAIPLRQELEELRTDLLGAAEADAVSTTPQSSTGALRQRANSLVLRVTQAHLAASKGAGFVAGHPAERAVREAMFFLVWSCPQPVVAAALREFACLAE